MLALPGCFAALIYSANRRASQAIYAEAECKLAEIERFVGKCEVRLSECLRQSALPPKELIEAIATAKVIHHIRTFCPLAPSAWRTHLSPV